MLLVDRNGICIDIDIHSNLWFLQEERLLGKNIFELMPEHTREKVYSTFETVLREQRSISKNYKLELKDDTYYFKCIMYPYDDNVLPISGHHPAKQRETPAGAGQQELTGDTESGPDRTVDVQHIRQCILLYGLHRSVMRRVLPKYLS